MIVLFIAIETLDLLTYLQAPHLEANPAMAWLPPVAVVLAKVVAVVAVVFIARRLTDHRAFALGVAIAIAAFSVGTNVAMLSVR